MTSPNTTPNTPSNTTPNPPSGWAPPPAVPAGPAPGLRYAGFWIRLVAFIIDAILLGIVTSALGPAVGAGSVVNTGTGAVINYQANGLGTLLGLIYFVAFWAWRGQTPGMMAFNMRIVRADTGEKVDVVRALLRYVGLIISFLVIFLGVIWVAFDARKQGWMDKIASTVVVRSA